MLWIIQGYIKGKTLPLKKRGTNCMIFKKWEINCTLDPRLRAADKNYWGTASQSVKMLLSAWLVNPRNISGLDQCNNSTTTK